MNNTVNFKIFLKDDDTQDLVEKELYTFNLNEKIIDIKNKILINTFKNEFNYIDFENITERVYKDYGKLFFDNGLLPVTIDNYKLSEFTNENRTFLFIAIPKNIEVVSKIIKNNKSPILKKYNQQKNQNSEKYNDKKENKNNFIFNIDDFPPLK
jgi:hypothetical protein